MEKEYIKIDPNLIEGWKNGSVDSTIRKFEDIDEYFSGQRLYVVDESFNKYGSIKIIQIYSCLLRNVHIIIEKYNLNYSSQDPNEIVDNLSEYYPHLTLNSRIIILHFDFTEVM